MRFNEYPNLEEKYAYTCWKNHRRDIDFIDKIIDRYIKLTKDLRKHKIK